MRTILTAVLLLVLSAMQGAAQAQQTSSQTRAVSSAGEAYDYWNSTKGYVPSSNFKTQVSDYTYLSYFKALYTYYGYNIRPGGSNPMTSYDRMWAWAAVARDADYAYRYFVQGIERGGIPWNSRTQRMLYLLWYAKLDTQAAADEAYEEFYYSYYFF